MAGNQKTRHGYHTGVLNPGSSRLALRARQSLAVVLSVLLTTQPLIVQAQEVRADRNAPAANQPGIDKAGNGVPLVNIVTPNGAGLSHNKYGDYNVGTPGLILNNSNQELSRSQLGGLVQGNANLKNSGPARVILNEVTGANRSLMEGATEVHGTAADVVIANPNGLTCNGCGFINAPRVTLSTGTPELGGDGSLARLRVERGDVTIGGNGADLSRSTIFDIVSRTISVNGPVQAGGDINLVTGRNSVAYGTGAVTPLGSDGNEPAIAIDSSALGGMYAGRIKLIATDKGAGVNMKGDMAANAGDMSLSADGKLTLGKVFAKGPATIRSTGQSVRIENTLFSDTAIVLEGKSAVELADKALVAAKGDVALNGAAVTLGNGALAASGMDSSGSLGTSGTLSVRADALHAGDTQLAAGGLLSLTAGLIDIARASDTGQDSLFSNGTITVEAGTIRAGNSRATAKGDLTLTSSGALTIEGGRFAAGNTLLATAASLNSSASLVAMAQAKLTANNGALVQSGNVQGNDGVAIRSAGDLTHSGRTVSTGHVSFSTDDTLTNSADGVIAAKQGMDLSGGDIANAGTVTTEGGALAVSTSKTLTNTGELSGASVVSLSAGGRFDNSGLIFGAGPFDLAAGSALTNSGEISSHNRLTLGVVGDLSNTGRILAAGDLAVAVTGSVSNGSAGTLQGGSILFASASLTNAGTIASTTGNLDATVKGSVENSGALTSHGDLFLRGGSFANSGKIASLGTTTIDGVGGHATGTVTNAAGGVINGFAGLFVDAASLYNAGMIGSGQGRLSARMSGDLSNTGLIYGSSGANITAGSNLANAGDISTGGALGLTVGGNAANTGKMLAASDLSIGTGRSLSNDAAASIQGKAVTIGAASLSNAGTLTTDSGDLALTLGGTLDNSGELSSRGALTATGITGLGNSGKLVSLGTMALTATGGATNTDNGLIDGGAGLAFGAASLANAGQFGSDSGSVVTRLSGNLDNNGLLYAGTSASYALDGAFTNTNADVVTEEGLTVAGLTGDRASAIVNSSGLIEAVAGDMVLKAGTVTNARMGGVSINPVTGSPVVTKDGNVTTTVVTTRDTASLSGPAGQILSGGSMLIDAGSLTNSYSLISAVRDLTIRANTVTNEGRDLIETVDTTIDTLHSQRYCSRRIFGKCISHKTRTWTTTDHSVATDTYDAIFGTIEAGGALTANVAGYLSNNAVRGNSGQTGLSSATPTITTATLAGTASPSAGIGSANLSGSIGIAARASVPLDQINVSIGALSGRKATFAAATSPDMPFLYETRSQFIDASKFLGSDYFLSRIGGYRPENNLKRLGDSYFEWRLVENQIFDSTGSRTLGTETDPAKIMQALYDAGVAEQQDLGFAFGVALTADQISRLTQDIVWMEKQAVDGKEVLVPRLYLSAATLANIDPASARIKGGSVAMAAGTLANSGTVASNSKLTIATAGSLLNDGGNLFGKSDIVIDAGDSFTNRSGVVSGNNIAISAASITNDTAVVRDVFANGLADRVQQTARIEAKGNLLLDSAGSVGSTGGSFKAGGDMVLSAGSSVDIKALQAQTSRNDTIKGGYDRSATVTHTLADLQAGGNFTATAGTDLTLVGVDAKAGGVANLKAGTDVTIASVQDSQRHDLKLDINSGGLFGTKVKIAESSAATTNRASTITAGGGLSIEVGRDATISASTLTAGSAKPADLDITAGRNVVIASGVDTSDRRSATSDKGFLSGSARSSSAYDETTVGSELKASGNVAIGAGNAAAISGSSVEAGKALSVTGSSVAVIGAEETHASSQTDKKSGLFVGSGDGFVSIYGSKSKSSETSSTSNVGSTLKAGTDVSLKATGTDVDIVGSKIEAARDIAVSAARDLNVTPGAEATASSSETKRSGFGISVSSGNGSASIGIGVAKSTDRTQQSSDTNAVSVLSAGRDVTIDAGSNVNLQAAKVDADRNVAIGAGQDVNLLAAQDQTNYSHVHEQLFAGVTLSVGSKIPEAIKTTGEAAVKLGNIHDGYSAANAGFGALKAYDALNPVAKGDIASASLTIGFQASKQTEKSFVSTPAVTTIYGGNSVSIDADNGNIVGHGAQIAAGSDNGAGDIHLSAGNDIILKSVGANTNTSSSNRSASASIGMGAKLNVFTGPGVGMTGSASVSSGSTAATSTTQINSRVEGTGNVTLQSGRDTKLAGAVVSGDSVKADIGRNLDIVSVPDTGKSSNKSASAGISVDAGSLSGIQIGGGKGSGATNWISEQSGLVSDGTMDVTVGGNTHLGAGKIVSNSGDLKLSTGTLTYENATGQKRYEGFNTNIGIALPGGGDTSKSTGNSTLEGSYKNDDTRQIVRATVGPGQITVRDPEKQKSLESDGTIAPLTDLNRDPDKAMEITRDKHIEVDAYLSSDSLQAAATAGKTLFDAAGEALDRMVADGTLSGTESQTIKDLLPYSDDPQVIAQLASCGQQRGDAGSSLFDWLIPSAHAGSTTCRITVDGRDFTVTAAWALTCLITFKNFANAATSAAGAAASRLLPALAFVLDPTIAGAPVNETRTLPDGTLIHVTGQQDELARHVLVTLPNGQQTTLVLTSNGNGGFDLISGSALGAQMSSSMLATMAGALSSGGLQVVYNEKAGMGHNGGPPLDDESSNGNNGSPNGKPPLVPPPVPGYNIDYDTVSTAKPGQATAPRTLEEQVVWNQVQRDPTSGERLTGLNNDPRFPTSNGWQKMQVTHRLPDGRSITIHYQFNSVSGMAYDMKFDTPKY